MRSKDRYGNVWAWSVRWVWCWTYLRHPFENNYLLDGGSRIVRLGPVEFRRMIQHDHDE